MVKYQILNSVENRILDKCSELDLSVSEFTHGIENILKSIYEKRNIDHNFTMMLERAIKNNKNQTRAENSVCELKGLERYGKALEESETYSDVKAQVGADFPLYYCSKNHPEEVLKLGIQLHEEYCYIPLSRQIKPELGPYVYEISLPDEFPLWWGGDENWDEYITNMEISGDFLRLISPLLLQ